ncbi:MAG: hypothetical protein ACI9ZF_002718 [Bradyrhizobium sp.]|jgi:hypothetical protein
MAGGAAKLSSADARCFSRQNRITMPERHPCIIMVLAIDDDSMHPDFLPRIFLAPSVCPNPTARSAAGAR